MKSTISRSGQDPTPINRAGKHQLKIMKSTSSRSGQDPDPLPHQQGKHPGPSQGESTQPAKGRCTHTLKQR